MGDAVFEGALDGAAMRAVFARHVANEAQVTACRVTRQRHRPGTRRFVQYAVAVLGADGETDELRVTGQWHAEPAHTAGLAAKLERRSRAAASGWRAALPPVFHDGPTGMLATTYPWDRRLPALVDLASGQAPAVLRAMANWMAVPPSSVTRSVVETMRYREQLNAVCRYTVSASPDGDERCAVFYVKAYGDDRGADAVARLGWLARATPAGLGVARVQRAVAYDRQARALVLAAAPGAPLDALPPDETRTLATLARVGTALARLGQRPLPADASLPRVDRMAAAARAATAFDEMLPDTASRVATLVARASAHLSDSPHGIVHGDLKLEHVFVDDDVWLIDLDSCHRGDPLWDLALLQARWWAARDAEANRGDLGRTGRRVLGAAYLAESNPDAASRMPALAALAYLDVGAGLAKRQEIDWRARAIRLVREAEGALDARG